MPALLFGSISTLADTSELQRAAFNEAFAAHGLDWQWDQDDYRTMLEGSGGADRIASYATSRGETVDAAAVHGTKSKLFQEKLSSSQVAPRPGVVETIREAKAAGLKLGFVTTTSPANVSALFAALAPAVQIADFDLVVDSTDVEEVKPDPASYLYAIDELGEAPATCVAVEDNVGGAQAASAAGIACQPFPNENTTEHSLGTQVPAVDRLEFEDLKGLLA